MVGHVEKTAKDSADEGNLQRSRMFFEEACSCRQFLELRSGFRCQAGTDFNAAIHLEPFNVQVRAGVDNKSDMMNGNE